MPTASDRAVAEAERWREIAGRWASDRVPEVYRDVAPSEREVVVFYDPADDLERRANRWGFVLRGPHIDELARFAASLGDAEAAAWEAEVADLAMQAFDSRRALLGERITHWAVPWLDALGRQHPELAESSWADRDTVLEIADHMRIAPALTGTEGLIVPGEDSFGPIDADVPFHRYLRSVWSGDVLLGDAVDSPSAAIYEAAADRWTSMASAHPGSAQLWMDLSDRAARTARDLRSPGGRSR